MARADVQRVAGDTRVFNRAIQDTSREAGRRNGGRRNRQDGGSITEKSSVEEIDKEARRMVAVARSLGYRVTADNLEYYLDGKGVPNSVAMAKKVPRRWLRGFKIVQEAEKRLRGYFQKETILDELKKRRLKKQGNPKTKITISDWFIGKISYNGAGTSNEELFFASGNSHIKSTGSFTITIEGDRVSVSGNVTHQWNDDYDFHNGLGVFIPGFGVIPDAAMKKLVTHGKAKEYKLICKWNQSLSATFKIGDPVSEINWCWGNVR